MAQYTTRKPNLTRLGKLGGAQNAQQILHVTANNASDEPALLALDAVADDGTITTYFLWVDSTGDLRIGTAIPTNQDGEGTVVGSQS